jgi:hypothetical protein
VLGLALIGAGLFTRSWWGAIGLFPLATAVAGLCPAYLPFGLSTRRAQATPRA